MTAQIKQHAAAYRVRLAVADDLEELVVMCGEHASYERAACDPEGLTDRLRHALRSRHPRLHAWVADAGDGLVGYATAAAEFSTWAGREYLHMDCLFVRDGWRGAGIGAALLAAVVAHARKCRCAEIQWQTPVWNEGAARFYRRAGAQEQSRRRFFLAV